MGSSSIEEKMSQFKNDFALSPTDLLEAAFGDNITYTPSGGSPSTLTARWYPNENIGFSIGGDNADFGVIRIAAADISNPTSADSIAISGVTWSIVQIGKESPFWELLLVRFSDTVNIQAVTLTADNWGSQTESWANSISNLACHFYTVSGNEIERLKKLEVDASFGLICNVQGTAISEDDRVVFGGENYDIIFIETDISRTGIWKLTLRKRE